MHTVELTELLVVEQLVVQLALVGLAEQLVRLSGGSSSCMLCILHGDCYASVAQ